MNDSVRKTALSLGGALALVSAGLAAAAPGGTGQETNAQLVQRGAYLARIGVCAACHTPPVTSLAKSPLSPEQQLVQLRANPDWVAYLDGDRPFAGGVPFILRFSADSSGLVVSRNLTPDPETGLGTWNTEEIKNAIKRGMRKDGTALFLFAPHTFYSNLADQDVTALALYLQSLKPVKNVILPRQLPFPAAAAATVSSLSMAPSGSSSVRGAYLLRSLVGCVECHSHRQKDGSLAELAGGMPHTGPISGVFRLGPDLPLRQDEKGFAAFPYPGYAALFANNLTRFGKGGDLAKVSDKTLMRAIRGGIGVYKDKYGRQVPLAHTMMWQFYGGMSENDTRAIVRYIRQVPYTPGYTGPGLVYFGERWDDMFQFVFDEPPSANDRLIFGKKL